VIGITGGVECDRPRHPQRWFRRSSGLIRLFIFYKESLSHGTLSRFPKSELNLHHVSKRFAGDDRTSPVLGSHRSVGESGEFVAIVGASGCRQVTLLRLIAGLDDQFDGDIEFAANAFVPPDLARGIVFPDHRLFPWLNVSRTLRLR